VYSVSCWVLSDQAVNSRCTGGGRSHGEVGAFVPAEFFGDLANEAIAERFRELFVSADQGVSVPGAIPLREPNGLALMCAANHGESGLRLSHRHSWMTALASYRPRIFKTVGDIG
jgi:hypothetical protein